jgi:hypothetical protein
MNNEVRLCMRPSDRRNSVQYTAWVFGEWWHTVSVCSRGLRRLWNIPNTPWPQHADLVFSTKPHHAAYEIVRRQPINKGWVYKVTIALTDGSHSRFTVHTCFGRWMDENLTHEHRYVRLEV